MNNPNKLTARLFDDTNHAPIDPFDLFEEWFAEAKEAELNDPNAMSVATCGADGMPDVRACLLNARDRRGFVFFTNMGSTKGDQLRENPKAALLFHWKSMRRQIRIRGDVEVVADKEADAYFVTRPHGSRVGAHASQQSRPLDSRQKLVDRVAEFEAKYPEDVPRPSYWSGYRIVPVSFEFWQDGQFRLHDRAVLTRQTGQWIKQRLYP